jgi:hypothetical protein
VDDIQRYAVAFAIELTDDQARSVLERCGWLTYAACEWIHRLIAAATRDLAD